MTVAVSWSGGKDSCLACYEAINQGLKVSHLMNFVMQDTGRTFHGITPALMQAQAQAMGISLWQREVTWETYEDGFKDLVKQLKQQGVSGLVFGDIDIQEHRDWVERVCQELGVAAIEPLWQRPRQQILDDFIALGFKAVVVCAKAELLGERWMGRKIAPAFLRDLRALNTDPPIDLCGEAGEYHTFVINGPLFKKRINILDAHAVQRNGYWFWEIENYELK